MRTTFHVYIPCSPTSEPLPVAPLTWNVAYFIILLMQTLSISYYFRESFLDSHLQIRSYFSSSCVVTDISWYFGYMSYHGVVHMVIAYVVAYMHCMYLSFRLTSYLFSPELAMAVWHLDIVTSGVDPFCNICLFCKMLFSVIIGKGNE